jgi:hypothetical protein
LLKACTRWGLIRRDAVLAKASLSSLRPMVTVVSGTEETLQVMIYKWLEFLAIGHVSSFFQSASRVSLLRIHINVERSNREMSFRQPIFSKDAQAGNFPQLSCKIASPLKLEQSFAESSNVEHSAYPWTPIFYPLASAVSTDTPTIRWQRNNDLHEPPCYFT